jgi:hypothetical protein
MSPRALPNSRGGDRPAQRGVPDIYAEAELARRRLGRFLLVWPVYVFLVTAAAVALGIWLSSLVPGH